MNVHTLTLTLLAGSACASPVLQDAGDASTTTNPHPQIITTITLDLSGIESWDGASSELNDRFEPFLFPGAHILGVGFDLSITTFNGSWYSEATIGITNALGDGVFITPGIGDDFTGTTPRFYTSNGIIDLANALPSTPLDFFLNADGIANIEFFESFDDGQNEIDAIYGEGSELKIQYLIPAPTSAATLLAGSLILTRRRR
jgi:hypothetical protein